MLLLNRKWIKGNIRLFKKIAASAFFFPNSNINCMNWEMFVDVSLLWMCELVFSCRSSVCENCFTSGWSGTRMLLLIGGFGVVVFMKHPFQGNFLFGIRQYGLFLYFDVSKLNHDPWFVINGPNTIVWRTFPCHDASLCLYTASAISYFIKVYCFSEQCQEQLIYSDFQRNVNGWRLFIHKMNDFTNCCFFEKHNIPVSSLFIM